MHKTGRPTHADLPAKKGIRAVSTLPELVYYRSGKQVA
jgi:hypothetical protein